MNWGDFESKLLMSDPGSNKINFAFLVTFICNICQHVEFSF